MLRTFVRMLFLPAVESPLAAVRHDQLHGMAGSGQP
jgi:hypothetical protein